MPTKITLKEPTTEDLLYNAREDNKKLKQKIDSYKQALKEISILAKNYCNACDELKAKTLKNKNDCLYCNYGFIRRKINEVLK